MLSVIVYGREDCEYSEAAKELLRERDVAFKEIDVASSPANMAEMIRRSGGHQTTPQIFINGRHIGGADDLRRFADGGGLDHATGDGVSAH